MVGQASVSRRIHCIQIYNIKLFEQCVLEKVLLSNRGFYLPLPFISMRFMSTKNRQWWCVFLRVVFYKIPIYYLSIYFIIFVQVLNCINKAYTLRMEHYLNVTVNRDC